MNSERRAATSLLTSEFEILNSSLSFYGDCNL
jgi:hypothetical protein